MNESNGYQLIKKVATVTGEKPSTGSIYPLLKSMEKDGWISGRARDGKTVYQITKSGLEKIKEFDEIKMDQMVKIHQSIVMANETFEDTGHLAIMGHSEILEILEPLIVDVGKLIQRGVKSERILRIINRATSDLRKIK